VEDIKQTKIEQYNHTLYNTKTNKITGFTPTIQEDVDVVFALSVDPLAKEYPDMSPYAFCLGNPIRYIDPDGEKVVDVTGQTVKVKIKKDTDGNYVASYSFSKNADQTTIDEFYANGAKIIDAMIKTPTGRKTVKQISRVMTKVHYTLADKDDKGFVGTNASGETGMVYGITHDVETYNKAGENNVRLVKKAEITIYLAALEYTKSINPETGLGDPNLLPGGESGAYANMKPRDPTRLYSGSEEEFLNGVGVHESTHVLNDNYVEVKGIGNIVDKDYKIINGKESEYYQKIEQLPDKKENRSRKEYNKKGK